jgi:hypothetical protein
MFRNKKNKITFFNCCAKIYFDNLTATIYYKNTNINNLSDLRKIYEIQGKNSLGHILQYQIKKFSYVYLIIYKL